MDLMMTMKNEILAHPLYVSFLDKTTDLNNIVLYQDICTKLCSVMESFLGTEQEEKCIPVYRKLMSLNLAHSLHKKGILRDFGPQDEQILEQILTAIQTSPQYEESILLLYWKPNAPHLQIAVEDKNNQDRLKMVYGLMLSTTDVTRYFRTQETESVLSPVFIADIKHSIGGYHTILMENHLDTSTATQVFYNMIVDGESLKEKVDSHIEGVCNGCRVIEQNVRITDVIRPPIGYGIKYVTVCEYHGIKEVETQLKFKLHYDMDDPGTYWLTYTPTSSVTWVKIQTIPIYDRIFQLTANNGIIFSTMDDENTLSILLALNPHLRYLNRTQLDENYFTLKVLEQVSSSMHNADRTFRDIELDILTVENRPYLAIHANRKTLFPANDDNGKFIYRWEILQLMLHPGALQIVVPKNTPLHSEEVEEMARLENEPMWSSGRTLTLRVPTDFLSRPRGLVILNPESTDNVPRNPTAPYIFAMHPEYKDIPLFDYTRPQDKSIFLDNQNDWNVETEWIPDSLYEGELTSVITIQDPEKSLSEMDKPEDVYCRFFFTEEVKELFTKHQCSGLNEPKGRAVLISAYKRSDMCSLKRMNSIRKIPANVVQTYYCAPKDLREEYEVVGVVIVLNGKDVWQAKKDGCDTLSFDFLTGFISGKINPPACYVSQPFSLHYDLMNGLPVRYNTVDTSSEPKEIGERELTFGVNPHTRIKRLGSQRTALGSKITELLFELQLLGLPGVTLDFSELSTINFVVGVYENRKLNPENGASVKGFRLTPIPAEVFRNPSIPDTYLTMTYRFAVKVDLTGCTSVETILNGDILLMIPSRTIRMTQETLVNPTGIKDLDFKSWYINSQIIVI